ncbi:MAG: hypothetical protein JST32_02485 [Bacteroidetes bacterium]|nr:hypothetical protein [Bacteroidota bacterium]
MNTKNKTGSKHSPSDHKRSGERHGSTSRGQKSEILYPQVSESGSQWESADANFSERNDVTPPNKKEFPSLGPSKTDFESRPQGRTTGRMISHEPGTEGS